MVEAVRLNYTNLDSSTVTRRRGSPKANAQLIQAFTSVQTLKDAAVLLPMVDRNGHAAIKRVYPSAFTDLTTLLTGAGVMNSSVLLRRGRYPQIMETMNEIGLPIGHFKYSGVQRGVLRVVSYYFSITRLNDQMTAGIQEAMANGMIDPKLFETRKLTRRH